MKKILLLSVVAVLVAVPFIVKNADTFPNKGTCSGCHPLDTAVTVTATFLGCTDNNAQYSVAVSNTYDGAEGWAAFSGATNLVNGTGAAGTFMVAAGQSYDVWGVSDSTTGKGGSDSETISPVCGAPTCPDADNDGYVVCDGVCTVPAGKQCGDCDDANPAVNPGAVEGPYGSATCTDGIDNDCDGLIDAKDAGCMAAMPSDYDIVALRCSHSASVGGAATIKVVIKNQGTTDPGALLSVSGDQGGAVIPIATVSVYDLVGDGRTTYTFTYTPVTSGNIVWTAALTDEDPDLDVATCTTIVK